MKDGPREWVGASDKGENCVSPLAIWHCVFSSSWWRSQLCIFFVLAGLCTFFISVYFLCGCGYGVCRSPFSSLSFFLFFLLALFSIFLGSSYLFFVSVCCGIVILDSLFVLYMVWFVWIRATLLDFYFYFLWFLLDSLFELFVVWI